MKEQRQRVKKKIILGLTGSLGCGKSTVAGIFKEYGAKVIDADRIAHTLMRPGKEAYQKVVRVFGKGILKNNKTVDRRKLGKIVFSERKALSRLNKIVHPQVIKIIKEKIKASSGGIIVLDVPLMVEAGLIKLADKLIVVKISRAKQIERIANKTSLAKKEILKRIAAQMPLSKKVSLADFVIDNNGTIKNTRRQVTQIRRKLWIN